MSLNSKSECIPPQKKISGLGQAISCQNDWNASWELNGWKIKEKKKKGTSIEATNLVLIKS